MKRLAILIALAIFPLAACGKEAPKPVAVSASDGVNALTSRAEAGDIDAMILLGEHYCANEPKEAGGKQTLAWWLKAAKAEETLFDARAARHLGRFYLNLYADEFLYDPERSQPQAYCTAGTAGKINGPKAVEWLAKCANDSWDGSCNIGLGHFYYYRKLYDKAYFWYATALAADVVQDGYRTGNRRHPADDLAPFDPEFYEPYNIRLVTLAGERLDAETKQKLNKRALHWYRKRDKRHGQAVKQ